MFPQPKRRRKNQAESDFHPFPVDDINAESEHIFAGYFTGINVEVFDAESIKKLYENGSFGIGSRTQAAPKVLWKGEIAPTKVSKEIYDKKCEWREQIDCCESKAEIIVNKTDDAGDPENDPMETVQIDPFHIEETLVLTLEESFFLHSTLKCLRILDSAGTVLDTNDILSRFCRLKPHFWTHFVAYSYLRSKNWIVKCGLKFGGDFLLYKKGPRYYHASYIVLVKRSDSQEYLNVNQLHGHYRISETSKKDLLIVEIYYPKHLVDETDPMRLLENLKMFRASEMTMKRFNYQQEH
ncbi:tRNA-splicing endonuclease subunit Sen2-1 [Bradysia coprophila]|uniref:tRNA-splicing endonuclease subunit Sen2-1 n=1 Tax=Bradysia coprophila TaxID=38358 RepID=UPI00187DC8BB|nr:tRNA-splicing endonuclease subunit Sen2-1 [Bradysia coprophila]